MTLKDQAAFLFLAVAIVALSTPFVRRRVELPLLLLNAAFVGIVYWGAPKSLPILVGAIVWHVVLLHVMHRTQRPEVRTGLYWLWLVGTVGGFLYFKGYEWLTAPILPSSWMAIVWETAGISFLIFRQIHLSLEVRDGQMPPPPILRYLNYTLAFWSFLAGPIQRYPDFVTQYERFGRRPAGPFARTVLLGLVRMMWGLIKMFVICYVLRNFYASSDDSPISLAGLIGFPLNLYLNFSGYCDIMNGMTAALGFKLPENFQSPFVARNGVDFWKRWHMTLSDFFRDYLYFPLQITLQRRIPALWALVIATLLSFITMGAWHGPQARFLVFGLLHGVWVAGTLLYQRGLKKWLTPKQMTGYRQSATVHGISVVACQVFVVFTFIPFRYDFAVWSSMLVRLATGEGR